MELKKNAPDIMILVTSPKWVQKMRRTRDSGVATCERESIPPEFPGLELSTIDANRTVRSKINPMLAEGEAPPPSAAEAESAMDAARSLRRKFRAKELSTQLSSKLLGLEAMALPDPNNNVKPSNWHVATDKATGRQYRFNKSTKKTQWLSNEVSDMAGAAGAAGAARAAGAGAHSLRDGWEEHVDKASGRRYRSNSGTGKMEWIDQKQVAADGNGGSSRMLDEAKAAQPRRSAALTSMILRSAREEPHSSQVR